MWKSVFPLIFLLLGVEGIFYYPAPNQMEISSNSYNYPNHSTDVDVIWRYSTSIQLEVEELLLDGESGDFLLISDLPLTFEDSFEEYHNSSVLPPFLGESIITSHGLLLSWELERGLKFQILSKHGTFIYFHAEGGLESRGSFPYTGFNISVKDLDELRKPPPTTTTEGSRPPPVPEVEIYTSKFLKNPPFQFRQQKDQFKAALASIATIYCLSQEDCRDSLTTNFSAEDVNIPTEGGLRMCDITWELFDSCVEVTFAITQEEESGGFFLPKWRLDDLWGRYGHLLESEGFLPYDNHPKPFVSLDTYLWMASFLGIILFLMVPVCIFWILNEVGSKHLPSAVSTDEMDKGDADGDNEGPKSPWADLSNPIRPILAKLKRQSVDNKYLEVGGSDGVNASGSEPTSGRYKPKTTTNVLFQENDVTFEYDNRGYLPESGELNEDEDEVVLYGHGHQVGGGGRDFMDIADEDFPPEDRFLRIERMGQLGENSDTEI